MSRIFRNLILQFLFVILTNSCLPQSFGGVWPGEQWTIATPASQGMSSEALCAAAEYAQKYGGGSGCVIRHGHLVKEWGDPYRLADIKSATKGAFGVTALGLAVGDGLVSMDDYAVQYYAKIGADSGENLRDWIGKITIQHLATMTAGFDDGRPPKLYYQPGTMGFYSNDTSNMLAELLTLKLNEDLKRVVKRRVLDVIGINPSAWKWRDNAYRAKSINNLKSREFASGIHITHRALARIGYLYLREGEWDGERILPRGFIHEATRPTRLPTFVPYYAYYWGSNAKGTYLRMPKDTFWTLGLGDSFVVVCPSLDIVAVRLGTGSTKSQLPGGDLPGAWGGRVEGFFRLVVDAVENRRKQTAHREAASQQVLRDNRLETGTTASPHLPPSSPVISRLTWAPATKILRQAKGSDNWPITWGDDGDLYTAYGDGFGFEPHVEKKLSLGLAQIIGGPHNPQGINLRSQSIEQLGQGAEGKKASGMLMVDGLLYMWVRNAQNSQLAWSEDHGRTWIWATWRFNTSFGCPTFLNFCKNYTGSRDNYVYVYSHDADSAYKPADRMVMARVPRTHISDRSAYEFFETLDDGHARWTKELKSRGAVFHNPGRCYRSGISYNPGLNRYLWCQILPESNDPRGPRFQGGFGIYDAPEPWGPWSTVYFTENWDVGPGDSSCFPTKWMSEDGKIVHLVFSGDDCFSVREASLTTIP